MDDDYNYRKGFGISPNPNEGSSPVLSEFSTPETKDGVSEMVYESLGDYFFDKITFISHPFSKAETNVTSTTSYNGESRLTDTSDGKSMNTGRKSRMRCGFYLTSGTKIEGYILSPAVYDSYSSLNTVSDMDILRAYVGIKFIDEKMYTVTKEAGEEEKLREIDLEVFDVQYSDTMLLDINHNVSSTEIFINSKKVGSVSSDLIGTYSATQTFLPLLSTMRSTDGTGVNITIENYQFIQDR